MGEIKVACRDPHSRAKAFLWSFLPILLLVLHSPNATYGEVVVTNITPTMSSPTAINPLDLGTHVATSPASGTITQITGGTRPGNGTNLFHSFDSFTLGTGDIAHFMNNMQLPTTNIFARVIGKEVSTIDGTLRTNIPGDPANPLNFGAANLWLVNPSGLLLGPNAHVEVGGSVSLSTANYLGFKGTSALFDMLSTPASLGRLSVAPVVAFGFLGSNPGTITVQGSQLSVPDGKSISLVGGNISIESGTPEGGTAQPVQLSAPNGRIQLASAASTGEFDAATLQSRPNAGGTSFTSFGSVSLAPGSNINVSGASTVFIKGGQLVLSVKDAVLTTSQTPGLLEETILLGRGSSIVTSNSGTDPGADVQLIASRVRMDGASMVSTTRGDEPGGDITVNVGRLSLANGALIQSDNFSSGIGQGGKVTIQGRSGAGSSADSVTLTNGAAIATRSTSPKQGGDVAIAARNVHLDFADIFTQTFGPGHGGDVDITAGRLTLENRATITTGTSAGNNGVGGDLSLNVGSLSLLGGLSGGSLIKSTTTSNGVGGNVTIQGISHEEGSVVDKVVLSGGSGITSLTTQSGAGGQISVTATSLDLDGGSSISSNTQGTGGGGNIVVGVQQLRVLGGAAISSNTTSGLGFLSAGAGGTVTVQGLGKEPEPKASSVELSGPNSGIKSDSTSGLPGAITVHAATLTITNGAVITAGSPLSTGPAGEVTVKADSVVISANGEIFSRSFAQDSGPVDIKANELTLDNGSIVASTASEKGGAGGNVVLNVGTVSLTNGASIKSQSETFSTGRAGDITMNVGSLTLANQAEITTSSKGIVADAGDAGNVTITTITSTGNRVSLASGSSITSATAGPGDAGQVIVTTPTLSLDNATITTSTSSSGNAGGLTANVGTLTLSNGAEISSSSTGTMSDAGDAGSVTIQGLASPANAVTITNSSLLTKAEGSGQGGDITVDAKTLTLNNATLSASVKDFNADDASDSAAVGTGNVALTVPTLTMTGGTISAETSGTRNGGTLTVRAENATFQNGATITSASSDAATGAAGSVTFQGLGSPAQTLTLTDTSVLTSTKGPGQGGLITMEASNMNLTNSTIATSSSGSGNAGDISINSKEVPGNTFEMWHSTMSTSAALADGGNIGIYATNMVRLTDSSITSSVGNETKTNTFGGNITIDPQFVILQNSQILAQAFAGAGGNITIVSNVFLADPSSLVDASSQLGISGTINIQSPLQNVAGELTALSQEFSSAAALLAQQCAARAADGKFSTFVVAAREGLPAEPGGFLASPSLTAELLGSRLSGRDPQTQVSAVTGLFPKYDARPIQLARFGDSCRR